MYHISAPYHNTVKLDLIDICWSGRRSKLKTFEWLFKQLSEAHRITSVSLYLYDQDALLRAATTCGYAPVPTELQSMLTSSDAAWLLLEKATGQRLAIERTEQGRLVLHTAGGRQQVYQVVHQHTLAQVLAHFAQRHVPVEMWSLATGTMHLLAHTRGSAEDDSVTAMYLDVQADGGVEVEIDGIGGPQRMDLVMALAKAIGARCVDLNLQEETRMLQLETISQFEEEEAELRHGAYRGDWSALR